MNLDEFSFIESNKPQAYYKGVRAYRLGRDMGSYPTTWTRANQNAFMDGWTSAYDTDVVVAMLKDEPMKSVASKDNKLNLNPKGIK